MTKKKVTPDTIAAMVTNFSHGKADNVLVKSLGLPDINYAIQVMHGQVIPTNKMLAKMAKALKYQPEELYKLARAGRSKRHPKEVIPSDFWELLDKGLEHRVSSLLASYGYTKNLQKRFSKLTVNEGLQRIIFVGLQAYQGFANDIWRCYAQEYMQGIVEKQPQRYARLKTLASAPCMVLSSLMRETTPVAQLAAQVATCLRGMKLYAATFTQAVSWNGKHYGAPELRRLGLLLDVLIIFANAIAVGQLAVEICDRIAALDEVFKA